MDELQLEALRFGVAILAGGFVAVISSVLAFMYARRLQREESQQRDARLRANLVAEIRENLRRIDSALRDEVPGAAIVREAWTEARALMVDDKAFDAIAIAYASGAELERAADFILGRIMQGGIAWQGLPEARARDKVLRPSDLRHLRVLRSSRVSAWCRISPSFRASSSW